MRGPFRCFSNTIGVLAPSRERFHLIAAVLDEPCVWLDEPPVGELVPLVDMFVIDSEQLAADPGSVRKWRELCRQSLAPAQTGALGGGACECACGQVVPPKAGRVIIYQCSEHPDADNPAQNT